MALHTRSILALSLSATLLFTAAPAMAKGKGGGGGGKGGGGYAPPKANPVNQALVADQQAISSARSDLAKANTALDQASVKVNADFENTPDMIAAKKAVTDAQTAVDAAKTAVMTRLADDPAHKAAADAEAAGEKKMETLKATDGTTQDQIADQATEDLKLSTATGKIEHDALDADQGYQDAQSKLTAANKAVADLRAAFKTSLKTDPTIGPLITTRDDAQTKLNTAVAQLSKDSSSARSSY